MPGRVFIFIVIFLSLTEQGFSQKSTEVRDQSWFGYFNQTRFTKRSGLWTDLHLRLTDDFVKSVSQTIVRFGYTYYVSDAVRLTAGHAFVTTAGNPDIPEQRPWQQIQWYDKKKGFNLTQFLRVEERFRKKVVAGELTDEYSFNWRFRYNFMFHLPLKGNEMKPAIPFLFINNEIFINVGKEIVYNYFDQNRFAIGLGYPFTSHLNVQVGYLNVFQQLPAGNKYVNVNAVRIFVYHNLDFRKAAGQ